MLVYTSLPFWFPDRDEIDNWTDIRRSSTTSIAAVFVNLGDRVITMDQENLSERERERDVRLTVKT